MDIRIIPAKLNGCLDAISSKSDAHRLLIAAALSDKETTVITNVISKDIMATIECLSALGSKITIVNSGGCVEINVSPIAVSGVPTLDCNESGSTARFLLPVTATLYKTAKMVGRGNLPNRPFTPLTTQMKSHNCTFSGDSLPLQVGGLLEGGEFELSGNVSSQFISGLMFALPLQKMNSVIKIATPLQSAGYVDMTIKTLSNFGVSVDKNGDSFYIKGNQPYKSSGQYIAEGDWSNSAFWLCAGAVCGAVSVRNLNPDSLQQDKQVANLLARFGAKIAHDNGCYQAEFNTLEAIEIDASEIPDLVPVLAAVASVSKGTTRIYNAERLKYKESDRLFTTAAALNAIGANVVSTNDGLIINGRSSLAGGVADSFNDHRIAMAVAVASCRADDEVVITNADAVEKSYPNFFEHYNSLGGRANVITDRK